MTPAGIEPATFRFVAQHLNHCATAIPDLTVHVLFIDVVHALGLLQHFIQDHKLPLVSNCLGSYEPFYGL